MNHNKSGPIFRTPINMSCCSCRGQNESHFGLYKIYGTTTLCCISWSEWERHSLWSIQESRKIGPVGQRSIVLYKSKWVRATHTLTYTRIPQSRPRNSAPPRMSCYSYTDRSVWHISICTRLTDPAQWAPFYILERHTNNPTSRALNGDICYIHRTYGGCWAFLTHLK